MKKSEQIQELATAFAKAQGELKPAHKNSQNPHFKSKFADLAEIWEASRAVLSKYGLSVSQLPEFIEGRGWVLVNLLLHSSGQWLASELPLKPAKDDNQGFGATITYMRRYVFCPLVGIVVDEDDDGETADGRGKTKISLQKKPEQQTTKTSIEIEKNDTKMHQFQPDTNSTKEPKISFEQLSQIMIVYAKTNDTFKENYENYMQEKWKVTKFEDLPLSAFEPTMNGIKKNLEMMAQQSVNNA